MKMIRRVLTVLCLAALATAVTVRAEDDNVKLKREVQEALATFKAKDTTFDKAIAKAYGYVLFPSVAKGGFVFGGAGGKGEVYEQGKFIGRARLSQGTFGAQVGGQVFSEIILFEDKTALGRFKESQFKMSAQATAVAASEGVAANAKYDNGVAILTMVKSGLMVEASVGGQKLEFLPLSEEEAKKQK